MRNGPLYNPYPLLLRPKKSKMAGKKTAKRPTWDNTVKGEEIEPKVYISLNGDVDGSVETVLRLTDSYEVGLD